MDLQQKTQASKAAATLSVTHDHELVIHDGQGLSLCSPDGQIKAIFMDNGDRVERFVQGWTPIHLHTGIERLKLLTFSGPNNVKAVWILDENNVRLGDKLSDLHDSDRCQLAASAEFILCRLLKEIFISPTPLADEIINNLLKADTKIFTELAASIKPNLPLSYKTVLLEEFNEITGIDNIHNAVKTIFEQQVRALVANNTLTWPSLAGGCDLKVQGSIILDDFRFAYRFWDDQASLVFYVIVSDHQSKVLGILIPGREIFITPDSWSRHLIDVYFPSGVMVPIFEHFLKWGQSLFSYLSGGKMRLASVMRPHGGVHLGHQIWNELSGIDLYYGTVGRASHPLWIVPGRQQSVELWGSINEIFADENIEVVRGLADISEITSFIYDQGLCGSRITGDFVSDRLRGRIIATVKGSAAYLKILQEMKAIRQGKETIDTPIFIVGLRVENRTLVNPTEFYESFAAFVRKKWEKATIVLDGHNISVSPDGSSAHIIGSHGESAAHTPPVEVEQEIAKRMSTVLAGSGVKFVSTVGLGIEVSLSWCMIADVFLSIWGASLAKYRWICNKPGFVITSRVNLRFRDDLHIYDSEKYMEAPAPICFVNPERVTDAYDADQLITVNRSNKFYANFLVDEDSVFEDFHRFYLSILEVASNGTILS